MRPIAGIISDLLTAGRKIIPDGWVLKIAQKRQKLKFYLHSKTGKDKNYGIQLNRTQRGSGVRNSPPLCAGKNFTAPSS